MVTVAFTLFYPAVIKKGMAPYKMPLFTDLNLYMDAPPLTNGVKRPLVIFSHGRGSSGPYYAWFTEYLAARGYIVATVYHYRANTYDATIMYLVNKLWQCPMDISLIITYLLENKMWGPKSILIALGLAIRREDSTALSDRRSDESNKDTISQFFTCSMDQQCHEFLRSICEKELTP